MIRRAAAVFLLAASLRAGSADDVKDVIRKAVSALRERNAPALWLLFDPKMPGYKDMRKDSEALLAVADANSTVDILKNEGDDRGRTLQLDWTMEITENQRGVSTTTRHAPVTCKLAFEGGEWKIVNFTPADFFAPTHAGQVWDLISGAAMALNSSNEDRPRNPAEFLGAFDPKMPGYADLVQNINGLTRLGPIECSVELLTNTGDDRSRTVEVDWSLQVVDQQTGISALSREQHMKFQTAWDGKHWRIAGLTPIDFFKP